MLQLDEILYCFQRNDSLPFHFSQLFWKGGALVDNNLCGKTNMNKDTLYSLVSSTEKKEKKNKTSESEGE